MIALILTGLLEGCFLFPDDCEDVVYRKFTEEEIALFPFERNDTSYFINMTDSNMYYFYCEEKKLVLRDSVYMQDKYCANNGFFRIQSTIAARLVSNYPEKERGVSLDIELSTTENSHRSYFFIHNVPSIFNLYYNSNTYMFEKINDFDKESADYYEKLKVGDYLIKEVFKFYVENDKFLPGIDTIYYNTDLGLLKLISRDNNIILVNKLLLE